MAYFKLKKTKWLNNSIGTMDDEGMQAEDNERVPIQHERGNINFYKIKLIWWYEWKNRTLIDQHFIDMVKLLSNYTSVCCCENPKKDGHHSRCDHMLYPSTNPTLNGFVFSIPSYRYSEVLDQFNTTYYRIPFAERRHWDEWAPRIPILDVLNERTVMGPLHRGEHYYHFFIDLNMGIFNFVPDLQHFLTEFMCIINLAIEQIINLDHSKFVQWIATNCTKLKLDSDSNFVLGLFKVGLHIHFPFLLVCDAIA
jgi:hypothetical protein